MSFSFDISGDLAELLTEQIKDKLEEMQVEEDQRDDLVQYIMLLLNNKRSKSHVTSELTAFLSDQMANDFVEWLWAELTGDDEEAAPEAKEETAPVVVMRKPHGRGVSDRLLKHAMKDSVESAMGNKIKRRKTSEPLKRVTIIEQEEKEEPARQIVVKKKKKRLTGEVVERSERLMAQAPPKPAPKAFIPPSKDTSKVIRCTFWPQCTKGAACPFVHPTEPCKFFPGCQYGKKCIYIHPPCRYGMACTKKPVCLYTHYAQKPGASGGPPGGPPLDASAGGDKSKIVCKFDLNCNKISCPFAHPQRTSKEQNFLKDEEAMKKSTAALSASLPQTPPRE